MTTEEMREAFEYIFRQAQHYREILELVPEGSDNWMLAKRLLGTRERELRELQELLDAGAANEEGEWR